VQNFITYTGENTIFYDSLKYELYGSKRSFRTMGPPSESRMCDHGQLVFKPCSLKAVQQTQQYHCSPASKQNGSLCQNNKVKLKEEICLSTVDDKMRNQKRYCVCLMSTTHDGKMVPARSKGEDLCLVPFPSNVIMQW
jgi:hypothetical protein